MGCTGGEERSAAGGRVVRGQPGVEGAAENGLARRMPLSLSLEWKLERSGSGHKHISRGAPPHDRIRLRDSVGERGRGLEAAAGIFLKEEAMHCTGPRSFLSFVKEEEPCQP